MSSHTNQSISDDQELAKVLAGVSQEADNNMQFEETGSVAAPSTVNPATISPDPAPAVDPVQTTDPDPVQNATSAAKDAAKTSLSSSSGRTVQLGAPQQSTTSDSTLDEIKQTALYELRPLINKLNVSPEEKFDTYLLLLRSTDDRDLIAPAHEAAVAIVDESRRAQALLDIVKEIDYFSESSK